MSKKGKENEDGNINNAAATPEDEISLIPEDSGTNVSGAEGEGNKQAGENENNDPEKIAPIKKELDELKDKYLRMAAEYDNYRKRTAKEVFDIRQTASKDLMVSLLEVLDDIDRAEIQINESEEKSHFIDGVQLIFNKFRKILEQRGLKQIETMYTHFDVEKDEAISEMVVEDEKLKGKVVAEVQKGYLLNDKLIRYAKVVVGK